jgi:hypothetical protein
MKVLSPVAGIATLLLFVACNKDLSVYNGPSDSGENDVEHFLSTEELSIPTKDGCITIVMQGTDTLATATTPMTILIPKSEVGTKATYASNIDMTYVPEAQFSNKTIFTSSNVLCQNICFEDSKNGDYDYNDLVIHVKYRRQGNVFGFCVQPIALGSSKSFKLGYILYSGDDVMYEGYIAPNSCREDLFNGQSGFINTSVDGKINQVIDGQISNYKSYLASATHCWKLTGEQAKQLMRVDWYIELQDGTKLFALSTKYVDQSFDKNHLPYGLITTNTGRVYKYQGQPVGKDWFDYPVENTSIKNVYPMLWEWMNTATSSYSSYDVYTVLDANADKVFPAIELGMYAVPTFDPCNKKYLMN